LLSPVNANNKKEYVFYTKYLLLGKNINNKILSTTDLTSLFHSAQFGSIQLNKSQQMRKYTILINYKDDNKECRHRKKNTQIIVIYLEMTIRFKNINTYYIKIHAIDFRSSLSGWANLLPLLLLFLVVHDSVILHTNTYREIN